MSTVLGLRFGGRIYMAADGHSTWGDSFAGGRTRKIHRYPYGVMVGCAGETRTTNVLAKLKDPPDLAEDLWLAIKGALEADGYEFKSHGDQGGGARCNGQNFMFATSDGLWVADSGGGLVQAPDFVPVGIGSGSEYGIGALCMFCRQGTVSDEAVRMAMLDAVRCAKSRDIYSGGTTLLAIRNGNEAAEEWLD